MAERNPLKSPWFSAGLGFSSQVWVEGFVLKLHTGSKKRAILQN
jgi:hypothetical protein